MKKLLTFQKSRYIILAWIQKPDMKRREKMKAMKIIAIAHERGQYDDKVKYEFDSAEEFRSWATAMRGVLMINEVYRVAKRG